LVTIEFVASDPLGQTWRFGVRVDGSPAAPKERLTIPIDRAMRTAVNRWALTHGHKTAGQAAAEMLRLFVESTR
jgi:hypothetical protein